MRSRIAIFFAVREVVFCRYGMENGRILSIQINKKGKVTAVGMKTSEEISVKFLREFLDFFKL